MNYAQKHFRDHADSEYVSYVWADCKGAKFIGNKKSSHSLNRSQKIQTLSFIS